MTRSLARGVVKGLGRLLGGRLPRAAREIAPVGAADTTLAALDRGACLLLVTRRRDWTLVPTPLWFARDGELAYVRTAADSPSWPAPGANRMSWSPRATTAADHWVGPCAREPAR